MISIIILWMVIFVFNSRPVIGFDPDSTSDLAESAAKCKDRWDLTFPTVKQFVDFECAVCLNLMAEIDDAWHDKTEVDSWRVWLDKKTMATWMCSRNSCYPFEYVKLNRQHPFDDSFLKQFASNFHLDVFLRCCDDARSCCNRLRQLPDDQIFTDSTRCPAKWDSWSCWDSAAAGTTVFQKCPASAQAALGFTPTDCSNEHAAKQCLSNGTWYRRWWLDGQEYTNYYLCSTPGATERIRQTYLSIAMYAVSLVLTGVGVVVFFIYGQYRVHLRVKIHLNFFASLILTCVFNILFLWLIRERHYRLESVINENPPWCILLLVLKKTSRLANYCWMLIEGVYLHKLIVAAFKEQTSLRHFLIIGWLGPVVVMIPYCIVHSLPQYNTGCWTQSMNHPEWIFNAVPFICIMINTILLVNIIRVLMTKLRGSPDHFKAGLRASLVLLPIFGIHYAFYTKSVDPLDSCDGFSYVIRYTQIVIEGLQGSFVTTIFCFLNSEVHSQFRRTYHRHFYRIPDVVTEERDIEKINGYQSS